MSVFDRFLNSIKLNDDDDLDDEEYFDEEDDSLDDSRPSRRFLAREEEEDPIFEEDAAPRRSIAEVLRTCPGTDIAILIGPEGDFSPGEARLALACGFVPVHLGPSRLRTETAAVTAVESVYFHFCL